MTPPRKNPKKCSYLFRVYHYYHEVNFFLKIALFFQGSDLHYPRSQLKSIDELDLNKEDEEYNVFGGSLDSGISTGQQTFKVCLLLMRTVFKSIVSKSKFSLTLFYQNLKLGFTYNKFNHNKKENHHFVSSKVQFELCQNRYTFVFEPYNACLIHDF